MEHAEFYRDLVSSITEEDTLKVARIMANHVGEKNLITLADLTREAFGEYNTSTERKTRDILEDLTVTHHLPVCAYSGKPGRWLAANHEEREQAARELETRGKNTLERARALRLAVVPAKELKDRPRQQSLWR